MLKVDLSAGQLQDGDVVVFRSTDYMSEHAYVQVSEQVKAWASTLPFRVHILVLDCSMTLETLPVGRMRQLGWAQVDEQNAYEASGVMKVE